MNIENCPVLYPTAKEFKNFSEYVEKIQKLYRSRYGMVKVVPPADSKFRAANYADRLEKLSVNQPIEQNIFGKGGVYECLHIQKKSLTLKEYQLKMGVFDKITEGKSTDEVQAMFWKNIVFSPPLYGADLLNTLMDDKAGSWNLNKLDSVLQSSINMSVKGVTTPYCYVGSWKTLFCWHKEDLDLSAINFLHEGKSKFWYSIPSHQSHILQKEAKLYFPDHFSKCNEYLRHKTTLINPYILKRKYPELCISKTEHKVNEFMMVFGGSYHCGFNFGFNIAQAVNYGTLTWLTQLPYVKSCNCSRSSVRASNYEIYCNLSTTPTAKTKQFSKFKEFIERQVEKQDEEEDKQNEKKGVKSQFSKKIKKQKKKVTRLTYRGEEYEVDSWAQCQKCNIWRKLARGHGVPQLKHFFCKDSSKKCHIKEKVGKEYITL